MMTQQEIYNSRKLSLLVRVGLTVCIVLSCALFNNVNGQKVGTPDMSETGRYKDSMKIGALLRQRREVVFKDQVKATRILEEIVELSKRADLPLAQYIALTEMAGDLGRQGAYREAIRYFQDALKVQGKGERGNDLAYLGMGLAYASLGKYDTALNNYYKALESLKDVSNRINTIDSSGVYNNIGIVWTLMGEFSNGISAFQMAKDIAALEKDSNTVSIATLNIGDAYLKRGDMDLAEQYYDKALAIVLKNKYITQHVAILAGLGTIYDKRGNYPKALGYLNEALAICRSSNMQADMNVSVRATIGTVYLHMKQYDMAKPLLTDALAKAKQMNQTELLESMEPDVASLYAALGDYKEAYEHQFRYSNIRDSLSKIERTRSLEIVTNKRGAEKDKAVIAQQLKIATQQSEIQKKNIVVGGTVLGTLLLLSIGFATILNYRQKQAIQKKAIDRLQQKQEVSQLKAQVRGEELERERIARELHDSVASQLWAINLNVENLQQNRHGNKQQLTSVLQQLGDVTNDVRKTAHNLMPDLLLQEGLSVALASICEKTARNTKLEVDFQEYGKLPRMDNEIELSIYRMVQELIQNVLKHAKDASAMLVQLSSMDGILGITVEDNGIAFVVSEKESGIGLQQIKKRVAALKGSFDIQSEPGKGTTVYLEFDTHNW